MSPKLCGKDKFLLVMMRLQLGLLLNDPEYSFQISPSSCSRIFSTWIRFLSRILGDALIVWLEKDIITTNLPDVFKGPYSKTRCIIDCTQIAIERPRPVIKQELGQITKRGTLSNSLLVLLHLAL